MAQFPRAPKLPTYLKKARLLPLPQSWKHNIDQSFITATPSEFKIRFTKDWVERTAKIPLEILSDPVEGSVEDVRARMSEESLPDSVDHDLHQHNTRHPKISKRDRESPKRGPTRGSHKIRNTANDDDISGLLKSSKDSRSPTPDNTRSQYSPSPHVKVKGHAPASKVSEKTPPSPLNTGPEQDQRIPQFLHEPPAPGRKFPETPLPTPPGRGTKALPVQGKPVEKQLSNNSSSNSFSVNEHFSEHKTIIEDITLEHKVVKPKNPNELLLIPPPHKGNLEGHHEQKSNSPDPLKPSGKEKAQRNHHPNMKQRRRSSKKTNLRFGKLMMRRRKVGVAFSPRSSIIQGPNESVREIMQDPEDLSVVVEKLQVNVTPNVADEEDEDDSDPPQVQAHSGGERSVEVGKDSEPTSSESNVIPLDYFKTERKAGGRNGLGVHELYFREVSPSDSDSVDGSGTTKIKKQSLFTSQEAKDGDTKREGVLEASNVMHVEGSSRHDDQQLVKNEQDELKAQPTAPTSTQRFKSTAQFPELATFVKRAKPSLARNPRLNWQGKPHPTVLYFESKIMPNRNKFPTKFVPLLPREEKLKRLYEANNYDEEFLAALTKQMAGKGLESDQISLIRDNASQASLLSQAEDEVKTNNDDKSNESLLRPIPPMNTPGDPSVTAVRNSKTVRNKSPL